MKCVYNYDEFCTNDQCPMCADFCPVPDMPGVCKYEEREEERCKLSPQGCLILSLSNIGITLDDETFNEMWNDFTALMEMHGYVQGED